MNEDNVTKEIIDILCCKFHRDPQDFGEEYWDLPLTGQPFYFTEIELVYLLFEIEKEYGLRIDSKYFDDYGYSSLYKIVNIVKNYTVKSSL